MVTCLHCVVDYMCESIDDALVCGVCFLDIEKCFDTINHDIVLQKLKHYGIGGNAFHIGAKPCPTGVPQGSILCPIIFLLYVDELPQYTGNQNCNIFADDAMIYSFGNDIIETQANLQSALNSLAPWYKANRRNINTNKSAVMLVGKYSQVNDASISININDVPLEQVNATKCLGVLVDGSMSWRNQCDNLCSRIAGKITVLRRLRSFVKSNTLKLLYEKKQSSL